MKNRLPATDRQNYLLVIFSAIISCYRAHSQAIQSKKRMDSTFLHPLTHADTHTHTYIYIESEREEERKKERKKERIPL